MFDITQLRRIYKRLDKDYDIKLGVADKYLITSRIREIKPKERIEAWLIAYDLLVEMGYSSKKFNELIELSKNDEKEYASAYLKF